jgi:murein L,D-transpeptidase YcbB/YkuD
MSARDLALAAYCAGALAGHVTVAQALTDRIVAAVERRTATAPEDSVWEAVERFYQARGFKPVWLREGGGVAASSVRELLRALANAGAAGLDPADYPTSAADALLRASADSDSAAALEITATYALLKYGIDVALGRVVPGAVDTMWSASTRRPDPVTLLGAAVDAPRFRWILASLGPMQRGASDLRTALATYRRIASRGGWPGVPSGPALRLGSSGPRVRALHQRLLVTGDLATLDSSDAFGQPTDSAVRRFQSRHGLDPDGIVGARTLSALNVSARARVRQLALNLERWRWLPRDLGPRYLMVNAAAYDLVLTDSGRIVDTYAVIVGRKDWPTPIVSAGLTVIVFNPRWNIPRSIALAEVLPAERRDSGYVARQRIHVLSDTTDHARELDPDSVDWRAVTDSTFALRLWMEPGPGNPLGRIRLAVPNRFNIALHDTPDTALFAEPARAFSHGCVRVAGVARLAATLARTLTDWPEDSVQAALVSPEERQLRLSRPVPVHFVYWTSWVDADGTVQFRPDEYGWDAELERAITARGRPEHPDADP